MMQQDRSTGMGDDGLVALQELVLLINLQISNL